MLTTETYLNLVNQRGKEGKPLKRVFTNILRQRDLFINAYGKIQRNQGALTPGIDGETADGTSLERIEKLMTDLKEGNFEWTPVRRTYIPKSNGQKRPLGIPTWRDRLIQEVIRTVLEAYYEPQFQPNSHGFRPGKGCHTALQEVTHWTGTKWFIEGDITGCFDNIDHDLLLKIIGQNIQDQKFLQLLRGMLKAGYLEEWRYHQTYSGTPQGGIASPILANIYLNEFDKWVKEKLILGWTKGENRPKNREYYRLCETARRKFKKGNIQEAKDIKKRISKMPTRDVYDPDFRRLCYVRYADDFLLGFIGPKAEAEQIKAQIKAFLTDTLNLKLNQEKTLITHASTKAARFLGYDITCSIHDDPRIKGFIVLRIPKAVTLNWIKRYSANGKPISRTRLLHQSDYEIVTTYGAELRGLYNYYKYALNVSKTLFRVKWYMETSMLKTLAHKNKMKVTQVVRKYKTKDLDTVAFRVTNRDGHTATFGGFRIIRVKNWQPMNDKANGYFRYGYTEVTKRLQAGKCEIPTCENTASIEIHHIRKLKDLKSQHQKRGKDVPIWVKEMIGRQRKTLAVCQFHHQAIHNGTYDGPKLSEIK